MEVEGGTVDYETSVNRMESLAKTVTSFCVMKVHLCPLYPLMVQRKHPLFLSGNEQEVLNEPNTPTSSEK